MSALEHLGAAVVRMDKEGAYAPPETSFALHGKLYASKSGWILLHVPNALGTGAFEALHEVGAELPEGPGGSAYNAHISVIRPEELEAIGRTPDDIVERGRDFAYTLGPVKTVNPSGWDEMRRVWYINVRSPELQALRKSYGLSAKPNEDKHEFHITFAVKRKDGVKTAAPTASLVHEPEKWMDQVARRFRTRRPMTQTTGGRFVSSGSTSRAPQLKAAAGLNIPHAVFNRWTVGPLAAAAVLGGLGMHMFPEPRGEDHLLPIDDEADAATPGAARLNNVLRWPKRYKWAAEDDVLARFSKTADLLPSVNLQPHQQRLYDESEEGPMRKLFLHSLGSGKSLSSLGVAEAGGDPYTAVVPAALRENYRKEQNKFTDMRTPSQVVSYNGLARNGADAFARPTVIFDEAQRLREPGSKQTQEALQLAAQAKRLVLLSGTPIVNEPSDLAVPMEMLTQSPMSREMFNDRYVTTKQIPRTWEGWWAGAEPGEQLAINNREDLEKRLAGKVDYHAPAESGVDVTEETRKVTMSPEQSALYHSFLGKLPAISRWKMERQFPLSQKEQRALMHFLAGPRQVGLSTLPFMRGKADPLKAFQQSPKLRAALARLEEGLKDPDHKAVVYSNFPAAGLHPYAAALDQRKIPYGMFTGGMSDAQRKKVVEDYNANKLRTLLIGPAGAEGISLRGTRRMQLLDPHWNETRLDQAIGRGLRYDSHMHLPPEQRKLLVERFQSELPPTTLARLASIFGGKAKPRPAADATLELMSQDKERLNEEFLSLLKHVGSRRQPAKPTTPLARLQRAKELSDHGEYDGKHAILSQMMQESPRDWRIDDPRGRHVGVTHIPTGFRLHMDRLKVPTGVAA